MQKLLVVKTGNDTFAVLSPDGGTGRRARLKIWLSQGSAGSIPVLGTNNPQLRLGIIYIKKELDVSSSAIQQFLTLFTKPYCLL